MATAKFVDTTAKLVDEGVDLGKILYQVSRAPYDSRVPVGDLGFTKLYGSNFYTQPFKNPNLYETQGDVLNAVALGEIPKRTGAEILKNKFNVRGVSSQQGKSYEDKFTNMLNDYVNKNPSIQQNYEDLIFYSNLLKKGQRKINPLKDNERIMTAAYYNRAINKAMDPEYLSEYGKLPFRIKYMNALKDVVDPTASIYSLSGGTFNKALAAGEQIAGARGLNLNFRPPKSVPNPQSGITGAGYQVENFATVNDGRTILPKALFLAREAKKAKTRSMSTKQFLANFNVGDRLDTGGYEYITPLRMSIHGREGKTFYELKNEVMGKTAGNKQRMDQINRLFEGNRPVVTLDHIQPQRFGGTNDSFNLRYIMESGHFGGIRQTAKESDELTMYVGSKGSTVNRPTVTDKTNFENDVYKRTMDIVDLVKNNKIDEAQELSNEVFFLVENFKKVNPSVDFKLGVPYVPVKSGKDTITYVPYHRHLKLSKEQTDKLFLPISKGDNVLLQNYENLPNAGDTIQKSFDKAYDRLAPFIMEGKTLTDADRKGLFEMKKDGGVVGFAAGGPVPTEPVKPEPTKEEKFIQNFMSQLPTKEGIKKQFFEGQPLPDWISSEPISRGFIEDIENMTPEQVIAVTDDIRLQGLENNIKKKKEKYEQSYNNENLSPEARQYIQTRNLYGNYIAEKRSLIEAARLCGAAPDSPGCAVKFPNNTFQGKPLSRNTEFEVIDYYNNIEQSEDFKLATARYNGEDFAETRKEVKNELRRNSIKNLPLATADLLLDFYQEISPPGMIAGQFQEGARINKGQDITREELADYIKSTNPSDLSDEFINEIIDNAFIEFDSGRGFMTGSTGTVEDKFDRRVYVPDRSIAGRELTTLETAKKYGISGLALLPLISNPTYVGKLTEVLSRKDIGNFGKAIRATPLALGIPTRKDLVGVFELLKQVAYKNKNAPIKIPNRVGQYVTATVKPGTENVFVVGSKTLPELGLSLPASEIAKRQAAGNMITNINLILNNLQDEKVQEKEKINEAEYQALKLKELKERKYDAEIKHYYNDALRSSVFDPSMFPDTKDIEYLTNLPFDPDETPDWVIRYAKELANTYIEQNNLKRNTIGDMLFYDMKNKEEPVDIIEDGLELDVNVGDKIPESMKKNKMAMGGDPGQFSDPLRLGDDESVDVQSIQQGSPYLGVDELDMFFEDANLRPTDRKEALPPEVQMANVVFGKAPGWAIAGVNKIDDLLRPGNTGQRIAQADVLADQATTVGEKANRFFSGIEARLIDPNSPEVFNGPEDLYNFLQSKGISKFEVEDYQIPQLIETMVKTGKPITKAGLLERIKNAPIRKLKSTVRGFRSETENIDGTFDRAKYGDSYYEKGSIPESYRENILYLEAGDIPGDVALYRHSTHGFFPDDSTNYVIGWTRGTDRYAIIPGTKGQVTNIGPKTDELNNKIERLTKIANRSPEDIVNQSGGRVSLEQATTNINKAKKQLTQAQEELANVGKTDDAIVTGDQTVRVTFADEIQSDIMQTYRKHLENVLDDYKQLVDKGIDVKDTTKIRQQSYSLGLKTDQDVLEFYAKHKSLFRPVFKTEEDFAAYIDDIRKSQAVFKDFAKIRPGTMTPAALAAVRQAGKDRDKVLAIFEEAFTNPETMKKLFPNIPFKDRKVWGDALVKNDLAMAAKRKFVDKDANAADWYVISPAELITNRYGQAGTTATPFAERTKNMKGIGQYEFYGGPNVTDPDGKHYTSILEQSLRRAAKVNNAEFKIVKVQIGEAKSVSRSVQIVNAQGDIVKEFKMAKSSKAEDFGDVMNKAEDYINESGAEGLMARPVETPSGFKTIDAYAIKLTPEMVLPTKTHLASGGYVRYDPLVSIDEMIGAA